LLTQLQPSITNVAVIYDASHQGIADQWTAINSITAPPLPRKLNFTAIDSRSSISQIESAIGAFIGPANTSGLVVTAGTLTGIS
jgi:hypothetical protein